MKLEFSLGNLVVGALALLAVGASFWGGYAYRDSRTPELSKNVQDLSQQVHYLTIENEQTYAENELLRHNGLAAVTFAAAVGRGYSWLQQLPVIDVNPTTYDFQGCAVYRPGRLWQKGAYIKGIELDGRCWLPYADNWITENEVRSYPKGVAQAIAL